METREAEKQSARGTLPANGDARDPAGAVEETSASKRNLKPLIYAIGAIVAVFVIIWGFRYFSYATTHQTTDDARIDANPVEVTSKINERVNHILVDIVPPVKKGQLLVVLDSVSERAAARGLIVPPLSSYYHDNPPRNGLVIGYAVAPLALARTAIASLTKIVIDVATNESKKKDRA